MTPERECPLTPALLQLLQACLDARSLNTTKLAELLCRSPNTIQSEFGRICRLLDVHSRFEAVMLAMQQGWVSPPLVDSNANVYQRGGRQPLFMAQFEQAG